MANHFACSKGKVRHWLRAYALKTQRALLPKRKNDTCSCEHCGRKYKYVKAKGHTLRVCNSCMSLKRKYRMKEELVKHLGGSCRACGYNQCIGALQFHHKGVKKFNIGNNYNRSLKSLMEEADKCLLVCANCHAEIHFGDRQWFK